jgi:hypothetical protein
MATTCKEPRFETFKAVRVVCRATRPRPALRLEVRCEVASPAEEAELLRVASFQRYAVIRRRLAAAKLRVEEGRDEGEEPCRTALSASAARHTAPAPPLLVPESR